MRSKPTETVAPLGHVATLDWLRLFAALAVVLYHYLYRGPLGEGFTSVAFEDGDWVRHLYLGVHLFFAISGFVIMASVKGRDALAFAVARFLRLWPLYALCATITLTVIAVADTPRLDASLAQWAANMTFLAPAFGQPFADGVYWSIVVELVFYAWVALMMLTGVLPRHVLVFGAGWLAVSAVNELWLGAGSLRFGMATLYAPWFVFGIAMHRVVTVGASAGAVLLASAAAALSMHHVVIEQVAITSEYGTVSDPLGVMALNAGLLALFASAVLWRHAARPSGWLAMAGALTYPLYLLHQNIGYVLLDELAPIAGKHAAVLLVVASMLLASWAVQRFFDRPARKGLGRMIDAVLSSLPFGLGARRAA